MKHPRLSPGRRASVEPSKAGTSQPPPHPSPGVRGGGGQHQVNRCLEPRRVLITCLCAMVHLGAEDTAGGAGREAEGFPLFHFFF